MKLLVVEDEQLLARQLIKLVKELRPDADIAGQTNSIESTVEWLSQNEKPDLILMDIELADGQCFNIFQRMEITSPLIFTTAYDEFALRAFTVNSIDYLLKPIKKEDLQRALNKYELLNSKKGSIELESFKSFVEKMVSNTRHNRERFLVKHGQKMVSISIEEIAFFSAKNTLNFIHTKSKQKFIIDYTLDEIEDMVPPNKFFRANRQYILSHDTITEINPWFNGKLKIEISLPIEEEIVISREKASLFKEWMGA
ncbi:MAG: LytR/AlgR family response regulator transcription factor [Flavitalea sp.]